MIITSISRHSKSIAALFFLIFYSELVGAALHRKVPVYNPGRVGYTGNKLRVLAAENPVVTASGKSITTAGPGRKLPSAKGGKPTRQRRQPSIGGPGQPEMAAFQSVNANNMVDLFSGDFSYNIPLIDVGGYPVGLSYRSGATMDQEASWVGLGWNINPGTISRNVRGLPDDFDGTEQVVKEYNIKKNWTAGITGAANAEVFGASIPKLGIGGSLGIFYNNYAGIGVSVGLDVKASLNMSTSKMPNNVDCKMDTTTSSKFLTGSLGLELNSQQGVNANTGIGFRTDKVNSSINNTSSIGVGASYNSRSGLQSLQLSAESNQYTLNEKNKKWESQSGNFSTPLLSFARPTYIPTITMPYSSYGFSMLLKVGGQAMGFHPNGSLRGNYSQQYIQKEDRVLSLPAYGYMYMQKANRNDAALLDFNREKDIPFRTQTPHAAIPVYTYDTYSISGEGTGGSFRPYRGDVGYVRDHKMSTKNGSGSIGLDPGIVPNLAHIAGNVQLTYATATQDRWQTLNLMLPRVQPRENDSTFEAVYFRNPGEQTTNDAAYYKLIGDEDVVSVALGGTRMEAGAAAVFKRYDKQKFLGNMPMAGAILKRKRDKRSQVISYLTAAEAQYAGMETAIKSYPVNVFPKGKCDNSFESIPRVEGQSGVRRANHLSEITVLNSDGRRYIYGLPAYNLQQKEVTFAVDKNSGNPATGLVGYIPGNENSVNNNKGKDNFFSSEKTAPYAHSFLLTGLLSPDYTDITGDGITEDDNGDAVKFNYSRMKWATAEGSVTNFKWRAPFDFAKANYNEGLRTDNSDDKGSYVYGEKEIWYMNSIESKTMLATFVLDTDTRKDAFSAAGENGGRDAAMGLKRLKEINLYSKADYYKNPAKARPIKTVKFYYSYKLCTGSPAAEAGQGKLTLDSLAFSYNGNKRSEKNKYRFAYHSTNPSYNSYSYDRWGNYRPATDNPGNLPNAEYPYAVQDKAKADNYAAAWNLSQISLPSGAKMEVQYESDDYGYVQNKRAMNMMKVAGMGQTAVLSQAKATLYEMPGFIKSDNQYLFIAVPAQVNSKEEIYRQYLEGVNKLYLRMTVKMPSDVYGSGYENIPFYSEYEDYGTTTDPYKFWVKLKSFGKDQYPPAVAAIQFLRLNMPSKAYPGSDLDGNASFRAILQALLGMGKQFKDAVTGFNKSKRQEGICRVFDTTRSFVRLNNPGLYKFGGGHRVKRIIIRDNWQSMTGQKESYYGQEYNYTTTREETYTDQGVKKVRTATMSSGVATYEPAIGNEENPWREPIEFEERVSMAPTDYFYTEYPYGEAFFPAPSIGYSKVTVSSINKRNLKSFNGWEETEFYTTKDFPVITDYSTFDGESRMRAKRRLNLGFVAGFRQRTTLSQGFKIALNDMNGKVKAQRSYAATDSLRPIAYTLSFYKTQTDNIHGTRLNNQVAVMDSANGIIKPDGIIGKDIELMMDFRQHHSFSTGVDVNMNLENFMLGIFPIMIPAFFPKFDMDDNLFRSIVTVKIIQRYGIMDSVVHYEKGSLVSTKNLVYDAETGGVLLSRTQNEFNDPIYNFSYPAHWVYSGMEPAYKNISAVFNKVDIDGGRIADAMKHIERHLESGDELLVTNPGSVTSNELAPCTLPAEAQKARSAKRLWVVDANKTNGLPTRDLYLVDRFGNPFTGFAAGFKIIRSGKRNVAGASVGAVTCLHDPVNKTNPLRWALQLDSASGVIATSAGVYRDNWTVDNSFLSEVRCDTIYKTDSVSLEPTSVAQVRNYTFGNDQTASQPPTTLNARFFAAGMHEAGKNRKECNGNVNTSIRYLSRGIIRFDGLANIPAHAVVNSASLKLTGIPPRNLWESNMGSCYWPDVTKAQSVYAQLWGSNTWLLTNRSWLQRITQPWGANTYFGQYDGISTAQNRVELPESTTGCQNYNQDCKNLVQDYVANPGSSYGFLMKLQNEIEQLPPGSTVVNIKHMSFYSGNDNNFYDCGSGGGQNAVINNPLPKLKVNYTYDTIVCRDTCVTVFNRRINPYIQGIWGNWRMNQSYTFYDSRKDSVADAASVTNIRRDGEFRRFVPFWNFGTAQLSQSGYDRWVWNAAVTRYNKRGLETENTDPLGRYNAGVYGYNQTLPIAVAQNARYRQTAFDGFEDYMYKNDACDQRCPPARHFDFSAYKNNLDSLHHHTGQYSLRVGVGQSASLNVAVITAAAADNAGAVSATIKTGCPRLDSFTVNSGVVNPVFSPVQGDTMVLSTWVKESQDCKCSSYNGNKVEVVYSGSGGDIGQPVVLKPTGNIIEGWQRYEEVMVIPAAATDMVLRLVNASGGNVYFDDLRLHPYHSNMKSFVYHPVNLRLTAELDENNYAAFYEYDDEGTLVRVKKETQRGIKTIQETRSVLLK